MKLNEKIRITEECLNSDERSYERVIMGLLVGSYKAAPWYRMEILSSRETSFETFGVEVSVYMPRQKTAYATFFIELNSMNIQPAGTQDEPKTIYYRGNFEEYKENEYKAYCAAADFMVRMEQPTANDEPAPETEPAAAQEAANEPEADATETPDEYAEARKLRARAYELRLRAENLNNEGKLHDDFVRYVEKLELQASEAVSRAYVAKNPRLAAALEKAKAKQGERAVTEQAATEAADEPATDNKEETKMTLENIYSQTLSNLDANDGDIVGVAVYTDGGDTVEEFDDVMDVINRYGNREVEPIMVDGYPMSMTEPDAHGMIHVALVEKKTTDEPAPELNYDFLSGRYGIFKHEGGTFSNEYETDDLQEARDYLKEETEGTVKRVDYAIFDRDARQYIQIRATAKGRKAFKVENERLAAKTATPVNQTEQDSAEAGQPAPQEAPDAGEPDALEVVRILGGTLNLIKDNGDEVEAMKARFALWEQVEEFKRRGVTLNVEYGTDGRFVGVTEPKAGMKFEELPESVQAKVKEYLRAYDDCSVTYERGAYRVSVGVGITARYAPDFKVCGRYAADDIFTPEERVLNYANSFYSYPPEYHGERDYRMMKAAQERGATLEYDSAGNIVAAA